MKKALLALAITAAMGATAQAQSETNTSTTDGLKASAGDVALEANVGIMNGNVSLSNALNQIKGRYFLSDDMALRLGFDISRNSGNLIDNNSNLVERSDFRFSINPGIEKHFAGTNRLSPYIGAELSVGVRSLNEEAEDANGDMRYETEGGWSNGDRGFFSVGVNAVAGMDFYVARNLFVGYELGFGFHLRNYADVESTTYINNNTTTTQTSDGNSSLSIGPRVLNGVRVGFVF